MRTLALQGVNVDFLISSEQNVREAFVLWATEQGYEIIKSREECPDFVVRKPNGEIEGLEVEKLASDFIAHGHDTADVDRIVCWRDDLGEDVPLPIVQLETEIDADDNLRNPRYVISESGSLDDEWLNQFLIWEDENTTRIKFRYHEREDDGWRLKSATTPNLSASEFSAIFGQIPCDVRRDAFCESSFDVLREYVEEEFDEDAFSDSVNRSVAIGTFHKPGGGRVSFGVMKSKPAFAIRAFNENDTFRSRGAVQLYEKDFNEFFSGIPDPIAERLFIQVDPDTALEKTKESLFPTANQLKPSNRE